MRTKIFLSFLLVVISTVGGQSQERKFKMHTVAFYNTENLYDTINDPKKRDDEWVYSSKYYWKKIGNIAKVLSQIGTNDKQKESPTVIGLSEIEHRTVLEDLVKDPLLIDKDYGIVHFESPDSRGIDCAFIYQKKYFKPTSYLNIPLNIYESDTRAPKKIRKEVEDDTDDRNDVDNRTKKINTRDQILLTGLLDGEEVHFIVNHWPSRRGGEKISSLLREKAAALNVRIIDSLQKINSNAKVMTMGDLNDGPFNNSLKKVLNAKANKKEVQPLGMYNPMENMAKDGLGTLAHRDAWDIFDQIVMTEPLIRNDYTAYTFWKAGIYNKPFMIQPAGQYKGYGLRNSATMPGFSDHFPVYIYLIKEVK